MLLVRRARRWALRKLICKIERHDDSKTISWHAAFPVRFARLLAALRLNSPLRGSDSGSLGRQHRKPHDGSLATVRAICFRIHHGCIILHTMFYNTVRLHIAKSSWLAGGVLKRNSPFRPNYKTRKNRDTVTVVNFRHCASVFFVLYTRKLMRKALVLKPVCVHWRCGRLFPASV